MPELTEFDRFYNPRFSVADFPRYAAEWSSASTRARAVLDAYLDVPYDVLQSQRMDIFPARGRSRALLLFIHGGYWRALDKKAFSFVAPAFVSAGVTVAVTNYSLCPAVTLHDIVRELVQASAWLYRNGTHFGAPHGPLYVCGHSAGGHLTAMLHTVRWRDVAPDLPADLIAGGLSISGLFDLHDLLKAPSINSDLRLNEASAGELSPALKSPASQGLLHLAVGESETEGFHIQHRLMLESWATAAKPVHCPGHNHFSILEPLAAPGGELFGAAVSMMGLSG